jgi:serine/threonine protein kinase
MRLAAGLAAAHARGVIHRDLKPSNVMLAGGDIGAPVIVDFGAARLLGDARDRRDATATGDQVGTLRYMAPEQIRHARTVDARADVFSLGCILYESLVGRACFVGSDPVNVLARVLFEPIALPSSSRPDLPRPLDDLTAAMLTRDVRRRRPQRRSRPARAPSPRSRCDRGPSGSPSPRTRTARREPREAR